MDLLDDPQKFGRGWGHPSNEPAASPGGTFRRSFITRTYRVDTIDRRPSDRSTFATQRLASRLLVVSLLGLLLASSLSTLTFGGLDPRAVGRPAPAHPFSATDQVSPAPGSAPAASPRTVGARPSGNPTYLEQFYANNSSFADQPQSNQLCQKSTSGTVHYTYCYPQAQNPSVLRLANGNTALAYSVYTTVSSSTCAGSVVNTATRIGFSISTSGGRSFGPITYLGNDSCAYLQATEPSFAVSGTGEIFGAFVEANKSTSKTYVFPPAYTGRSGDALGFVTSSNNGATWSSVVTLNRDGNITHPVLAAFGRSVYIVYENSSNSTTTYPGGISSGSFHAISLDLYRSLDAGKTWTGPTYLPELNSSMGYWSTAASLAVNATGTLAVAYATNRTCVSGCASPAAAYYGDAVVEASSATNGSTWGPIHVVKRLAGESHCWSGYNGNFQCFTAAVEWTPQTTIAFGPNGRTLFVGWAGTYPVPGVLSTSSWSHAGVFAAVSTTGGSSWKVTPVAANLNGYLGNDFYLPAVGVAANGTVYLTYTEENSTTCAGSGCSALVGSYSQWVVTSANGVNWTAPLLVSFSYRGSPSTASTSWSGWESSVGFTSGGVPMLVYALPKASTARVVLVGSTYYYNYTYPTNLTVAYPYSGAIVPVTFIQTGLAAGTLWSMALNGEPFNSTTNALTVSNVPVNLTVAVDHPLVTAGFWTKETSFSSVGTAARFNRTSTVYFNLSEAFGLQLLFTPAWIPNLYLSFTYNSTYYYIQEYRSCYSGNCYRNVYQFPTTVPWYFPAGVVLDITSTNSIPAVGYWNGTGKGAFTGYGSQANVTMDGPINETAWAIAAGVYNESFHPVGLPSTSVFSFTFGSHLYSSPANQTANVSNVGTGAYALSGIQANSSNPGWEYFGYSSVGSTVVVPAEPVVNLSFANVHVAAPAGIVPFRANGFVAGTVWALTFNGTSYASATPWINVSTRPGSFPWSVAPAVSGNGSVGYVPGTVGPTVSVTPGTTVGVPFTPAFRVDVVPGVGGAVSGSGVHWLANGSAAKYIASPYPGYRFVQWAGDGSGSFTGASLNASILALGPIVESASFAPLPTDRFNVTLIASGLAPGTWWSVFLNGVGFSSDQANFTVYGLYSCSAGAAGHYNLTLPTAYPNGTALTRYVPGTYRSSFCINSAAPIVVPFSTEYGLTVASTPGGFATVTMGTTTTDQLLWAASGSLVQVEEYPDSGYSFLGWNGTGVGAYTGTSYAPPVGIGGPIVELASFGPSLPTVAPTFTARFYPSTSLAPGTIWNFTLDGVGYSTGLAWLNVSGLASRTHNLSVGVSFAPDGLTRYTPVGVNPHFSISGANVSVPISFVRAYWVVVAGSAGGLVTPASNWFAAGQSLMLSATPNAGYQFQSWAGVGPNAYSGNLSSTNVVVSAPIVESATFLPIAPSATASSSGGPWSSPATIVLLVVVGAVVGAVAGLLLTRLTRRRSAPDREEPVAEESRAAPAEYEEYSEENPP